MKVYMVSVGHRTPYLLRAVSIAWAATFVRHWGAVRIERINYAFNPRPQWHKNLPVNA